MVEARYLSVQRFKEQTTLNRRKGNTAEIYSLCLGLYIGLQENILQTVTYVKRYL